MFISSMCLKNTCPIIPEKEWENKLMVCIKNNAPHHGIHEASALPGIPKSKRTELACNATDACSGAKSKDESRGGMCTVGTSN